MNGMQVFSFEGAPVRVVAVDGEPWWVANDVAKALGFGHTPHAARLLRDDQKGVHSVDTPGGAQMMTVISESGLYRLVMRSRRREAERFQDWVTEEVLPAIRRTGKYSAHTPPPEARALPGTYLEALRALVTEVEAREVAERRAAEQERAAELAQAEALALAPPAAAWSALADAAGDYSVADAAKILSRDPAIDIGRNRLFGKLVELGMAMRSLERRKTVYRPYQKHVDAGRLVLKMGDRWRHPRTNEWESGAPTLRVTAKGLEYLRRKLGGTSPLQLRGRSDQLAAQEH